jgi:hypothetical protein
MKMDIDSFIQQFPVISSMQVKQEALAILLINRSAVLRCPFESRLSLLILKVFDDVV